MRDLESTRKAHHSLSITVQGDVLRALQKQNLHNPTRWELQSRFQDGESEAWAVQSPGSQAMI